ncbi:MAG: DUF4249 domain-containing protein [Melioribacteraceae bacterium]|nr:DUF4249 domain-containing protein [Melioribacteraceae bacterium]
MKIIKYILLVFLSVLFLHCEQIDVIESDIPYKEFYIVNGRLVGGSSDVRVSFTKSFPIEANVPREAVALKDVTAYIWSETQGIFPLKYVEDGIYIPASTLTIKEGVTYELYGKYKEERIFSVTEVPSRQTIVEAKLQGNYLLCQVIPNVKTVYAAKYILTSTSPYLESYSEDIFFEVSGKTLDTLNTIDVRTSTIPLVYFENSENYILEVVLYSFDEAYKDYFSTRENNKPIENIFSEGGGSVYWNVYGKNTIGLFIGYTKTTIEIK